MKPFIVALDGPAGAGKSSVARAVATRLGMALVDTGALYRCVALAAKRAGVDWQDEPKLASLLEGLDIRFEQVEGSPRVLLAGEDVTEAIRTPELSLGASAVSALPAVRAGLLELQRRLGREAPSGAVLEGRDIGTVVFPDADLKLFITASEEVRAQRRHAELCARGIPATFEEVLADQRRRDVADSTRELAPLKPAPDARLLDTSALGLDEVIDLVAREVEAMRARRG